MGGRAYVCVCCIEILFKARRRIRGKPLWKGGGGGGGDGASAKRRAGGKEGAE